MQPQPMTDPINFHHASPILRVNNLDASIRYFCETLGFSLDWQDPTHFASVSRGDANLMLSVGDQGSPPAWVWIGGGLYMPATSELQAIRETIAATHPQLHRLVTASTFRRRVGTLDGEQLTRVPRGYASDHPAAQYLRFKQFLAGREYDAAFATTSGFYAELLAVFRAVTPLVRCSTSPAQGP